MSAWRAQITFPERFEALTLVARGVLRLAHGKKLRLIP
jgi:hypothetical protein